MLTERQIKWAASHDWFVKDNGDGTIIVRDKYMFSGFLFTDEITWNKSFSELRDWAGY